MTPKRCVRGHEWTYENTKIDKRWKRVCIECEKFRKRQKLLKMKFYFATKRKERANALHYKAKQGK